MGGNETMKNPIIEKTIKLPETEGLYKFFCKTTAALFMLAMSILSLELDVLTIGQFEKLVSCLWIVKHNARKLENICSISSSVHDNARCALWRKIKNCICQKCYAYNQQTRQTGLKEHNIINGIILRNVLIPVKAFKKLVIIFPYLRIESFGDVQNITQARNYIRIIKAFPRKRCAIWTKNVDIWHKAFEMEGKRRMTQATQGLERLRENVDSILVIPNDKLKEVPKILETPYIEGNAPYKLITT